MAITRDNIFVCFTLSFLEKIMFIIEHIIDNKRINLMEFIKNN